MSTSSLAGLRRSGTTSTCWGWVSHSDGRKSNWSHDEEEMKMLATVRWHCCKWWEVFLFAVGDTLGARRQIPYGVGKLCHRGAERWQEWVKKGWRAVPSEATSSQSAVTAADSPLPTGHVKLQPMLETIHLLDLTINEYSTWALIEQYSAKGAFKKAFTSNCNDPVQK